MPLHSILFDRPGIGEAPDEQEPPDYFTDLRLDRIVTAVTAGRDEYRLAPYFQATLDNVATIHYRLEVFRDLEVPAIRRIFESLSDGMRAMREHLDHRAKVHNTYERARWFLAAAAVYCDAVGPMASDLVAAAPRSAGMRDLADYLTSYLASDGFTTLLADTRGLIRKLNEIRYRLSVVGNRIRVSLPDADEPDYSTEVARTFAKFQQGAPKEYRFQFASPPWLNHVEAEVLDRVALLYPDTFADLEAFGVRHERFLDETIRRFDREVQFYVAYLEHVERLRQTELSFCYPEVTDGSRSERGRATFDLALAAILVDERTPVITNDFSLDDPERILVVSGPNQGGKTTFARMIGQLHHLAAIGCPVPGTESRLALVDRIFSHFEREEDLENLSGKLEEELRRIHGILGLATSRSLLIMNESFGSTTVHDALLLGREILEEITERDLLGVYVTFLDELASLGPTTVSMTSTVEPDDPARRTFRIVRQPADGLAYALAIAEKHHLTYERVKARLAS